MAKLPQIDAIKLSKIIKKLGFQFIRQKGSHMFFKHSDGRTTVIPYHSGEKICQVFSVGLLVLLRARLKSKALR